MASSAFAAAMSARNCGVHYPSDVEAGRTVGAALVARLHAEPQFLADMAAAKAELATAERVQCKLSPAG